MPTVMIHPVKGSEAHVRHRGPQACSWWRPLETLAAAQPISETISSSHILVARVIAIGSQAADPATPFPDRAATARYTEGTANLTDLKGLRL